MDLKGINLFDVLAAPTVERSAIPVTQTVVNLEDFTPEIKFHPAEIEKEVVEVEEIDAEPYDAVREAEKLVELIDIGSALLLTPIAGYKMQRNRGGKKGLAAMKPAYIKQRTGAKLTEEEQKLADAFEAYKADLQLLSGEIPFSDSQKQKLIRLATSMCQEKKIKTDETFAFWIILAGMEMGKIMKILSA